MEIINQLKLFFHTGTRSADAFIDKFSKQHPGIYFIQVGANDGQSGDPIYKYVNRDKWQGILIEPLKYVFDALKYNYRHCSGLIFVNAALSDTVGEKEFYKIEEKEELMREGFHQLASFNKDVILKHAHRLENMEQYIVTEKIKTVTFDSLVKEYNIAHVTLMHIDTEGYDFEVLKMFPFKKFLPRVVLFENKHLSAADNAAADKLLHEHGYKLFSLGDDTLAILKTAE